MNPLAALATFQLWVRPGVWPRAMGAKVRASDAAPRSCSSLVLGPGVTKYAPRADPPYVTGDPEQSAFWLIVLASPGCV